MLLLTRNEGQCIIVNQEIIVKVIHVRGRQVMIGIQAPDGMSIHREEIQRRIDEERLFNEIYHGVRK